MTDQVWTAQRYLFSLASYGLNTDLYQGFEWVCVNGYLTLDYFLLLDNWKATMDQARSTISKIVSTIQNYPNLWNDCLIILSKMFIMYLTLNVWFNNGCFWCRFVYYYENNLQYFRWPRLKSIKWWGLIHYNTLEETMSWIHTIFSDVL